MISQITPGRDQAGEAGEVDARLGLAGALEHAAVLGLQREDVAGLDAGRSGVEWGSIATWIVRARSAAEIPVVTPSRGLDRDRERGLQRRLVLRRHQVEAELVAALARSAPGRSARAPPSP